jgi:hypothetical protein
MGSTGRFRRLLFILGTVIALIAALAGTKLATRPVKALVTTQDVIIFHCSVIPGQPITALGFSNYTRARMLPTSIQAVVHSDGRCS